MTTAKRDALLSSMTLVRPALATQSFIPAWTHILLADGFATTYNDTMSIQVRAPLDGLESVCVPGEMFIRALGSFNAETVLLQEHGDAQALLLTSGRSKLKVPVLPAADFKLPNLKGTPAEVALTDDILVGIKQCLFSVGADPTHPAQMGVTLGVLGDGSRGAAVLYSTDNTAISRYCTTSKIELPGGAPIILPTHFCEQLLVLAKAFPEDDLDLLVYPGAVKVQVGKKASLLTKMMVDLEPLDFESIISKYLDVAEVKKHLSVLPPAFDAAFNRALLVLASETDKATKITPERDGSVSLFSKTALGEAEDDFTLDKKADGKPFHVDPSLVLRAAKTCGSVAFYPRVLVLASDDAKFIHLIAHCAA